MVIIGWILVTVTFVLSGIFLVLHNVLADTCVALDEWVKNPKAHTAFNDILPCVDNPTAQEALNKTKDVTFLLEPFPSTNKTHRNCADHDVDFIHAATEWRNYVCEVSATGICTTVGRPTPTTYEELVGAVNVSYALYHYGPFLVDLEECSFVRETRREISEDHCPALRRHTRWIVMLLAMVSASLMVSTSFINGFYQLLATPLKTSAEISQQQFTGVNLFYHVVVDE